MPKNISFSPQDHTRGCCGLWADSFLLLLIQGIAGVDDPEIVAGVLFGFGISLLYVIPWRLYESTNEFKFKILEVIFTVLPLIIGGYWLVFGNYIELSRIGNTMYFNFTSDQKFAIGLCISPVFGLILRQLMGQNSLQPNYSHT
ncbi:MAG: hypothetical protein ACXAEF_12835, partial [Candidatus Thorarchaeota archaeon]